MRRLFLNWAHNLISSYNRRIYGVKLGVSIFKSCFSGSSCVDCQRFVIMVFLFGESKYTMSRLFNSESLELLSYIFQPSNGSFSAGHVLDLRVISFLRSLKLPPTSPIYVYISAEDVVTRNFPFQTKVLAGYIHADLVSLFRNIIRIIMA